uniref:Uncharacterized protein n=1 Tax=Alexandrium monilatum TaxID=311494 RepID=A0A7S4QSW4_9DINO|mmetsp:Transcript_86197/g.257315  ORF Transcript_86197/g.257315 Transcript_86197/m.257315 type:complete len:281 (+) Transcript_86197:99-941(+)
MGRKKKDDGDASAMGVLPMCPNQHALQRRVADGEFECDICSTDIASGMCFFGCAPCDYSLCNGCYIKLATGTLEGQEGGGDTPGAVDVITGARVDPDVAELCEHFSIEDRIMLKLNEVMRERQVSFAGDIEKLWDELDGARSPAGLLMAKIRQMQEGTFVGKVKPPKDVQRLIEKYRLDQDARNKLTGFICSRPTSAKEDLFEIERRLETSGNPSATVMTMMVKLHRGERLPEPFRAAPHRDFGTLSTSGSSRRSQERERDPDRRRSRSRGRRSRSRGRR